MTTYPQRIADNILPLSAAKNLADAFKEWFFNGNFVDKEKAEEVCQLCDQKGLRYHFQIENKHTKKLLWIGSSCILKFNIEVYDDKGVVLDKMSAEKKLKSLEKQMRFDSCIKALETLAKSEKNIILDSALSYYKQNGYLTPKYAFVIFWRLNTHGIDYHPSFFKIRIKKKSHKLDLQRMDSSKIRLIWPALTSSQQQIAIEAGYKPPKS
ncbi:MAG: hypothetical protein K8S87_12755 [Planctomycetes bacterium]|nr:hypothetical protein [Planctomycetota bacterium]